MAALPLSHQYSICTHHRLSALKSPQSGPKNLSFQQPILGLSRSFQFHTSSPPQNRRFSFSTAKDTTVETSEDEAQLEESESDRNEESVLSVKSLLLLYKEAVLNEDDTTTSEIEATLSDLENEKNKLFGQVRALSEEANSGKERYIRLQADFENFRKRSEKERLSIRSNAQGEVIESLLPMVDNFERAKHQLKLETEQEKKIDASYQGIYKQFVEIMRSLQVAVVPTVGKPFDPSVHEAIAREESKEFSEGIVIQEFRRGFVLGERLLRPAMVKVSSGPGQADPSTQESTEQS
ncbi:putative GrpE nucleotide exchange factor [Helianthus anomalus]